MNQPTPSFHVITKGHYTKNGNYIGIDSGRNNVFIKKNIIELHYKNVNEIKYPLFVLAQVTTYNKLSGKLGDTNRVEEKDINENVIKFKRLTAISVFKSIDHLIDTLSEPIRNDILINPEKAFQCLLQLKKYVSLYFLYIETRIFQDNSSLRKKYFDDMSFRFNADIFVNLIGFYPDAFLSVLEKNGVSFSRYDRMADYDLESSEEDKDADKTDIEFFIWQLNLFNESKFDYKIAKKKIITYKNFRQQIKSGHNYDDYLFQFYHTNNIDKQIFSQDQMGFAERILSLYERETFREFKERCRKAFDTPMIYVIEPIIEWNAKPEIISQIHNKLSILCEGLYYRDISNFMVIPPNRHEIDGILDDQVEVLDSIYEAMREDEQSTSEDELRRWDEETD